MTAGDSFGDYTVVRLLGKGGMGEVWLLEGVSGQLVAAKILDPAEAGDAESRKRFLREAQLALGVKHPNLVEVYDVGEDPETGLCYILMEYVPGGSLGNRLDQGPLPVQEALSIVYQIATVLELARQKGIVHRDIKPDNIMFGADGTAKLADLGIARQGGGTVTTTVTQAGTMIGTPAYMAPEQMLDSHNVDTRADIYSLGIVFYEMLTGVRPNKDDTVVQLMAKAMQGVPIPDVRTFRPEVSAAVAGLVSLMCAMNVDERVQTPYDVTLALSQIAHGREVTIQRKRPSSPVVKSPAVRSGDGVRRLVAAVFGLLAVVGIAVFGYQAVHRPAPPQSAKTAVSDVPSDIQREDRQPECLRQTETRIREVTNVVARTVVTTSVVERVVESKRSHPERTVQAPRRVAQRASSIFLDLGQGEKLEFVSCPTGTFEMGWAFEPPSSPYAAHRVEFTRPFWMARYQLTRRQWCALTGHDVHLSDVDELLGGADCPVWSMPRATVIGLCRKLTERHAALLPKGCVVRFPTYAEWEYALRAGDENPEDSHYRFHFHRSAEAFDQIAWTPADTRRVLAAAGHETFPSLEAMNAVFAKKWRDRLQISEQEEKWLGEVIKSAAVGRKAPNSWGIYDMLGNGHETLLDTAPSSLRGDCVRAGLSWTGMTRDPLFVSREDPPMQMIALEKTGKISVRMGLRTATIRLVIGSTDFNDARTALVTIEEALSTHDKGERENSADQSRLETSKPRKIKQVPALPVKTFALNRNVEMNMVGCPAGVFQMGYAGAPPTAKVATVHEVSITRPYWIARHPVTRNQWAALMGDVRLTPVDKALGGMDAPMTAVANEAIRDYGQKLTRKFRGKIPKGYVFRLPTDAEWEYAARGGLDDPDDPYVDGRKSLERRALIAVSRADKIARLKKSGVGERQMPNDQNWFVGSYEVCTKKPNGWGLYDLVGNVDERVLDTFPVENPNGSFKRSIEFVKGEISYQPSETDPLRWHDDSDAIGMIRTNLDGGHIGKRRFYSLGMRHNQVGFRLVLGPDLERERKMATRNKTKRK